MLDLYQSLGRRSKFYKRLHSNYACLQALVNNAFVNNTFTWKSSCMIDVIKYIVNFEIIALDK